MVAKYNISLITLKQSKYNISNTNRKVGGLRKYSSANCFNVGGKEKKLLKLEIWCFFNDDTNNFLHIFLLKLEGFLKSSNTDT